jgi:hypothetical protein
MVALHKRLPYPLVSMQTTRSFRAAVSALVILGLLSFALVRPTQAALVGSDALLADPAPRAVTGRHGQVRAQLRERLLERGVGGGAIEARLAGLSDDEVARLAERLDELPAGGDALELLVLVFLVLLFTDILGLTDVYTFVKKPARR